MVVKVSFNILVVSLFSWLIIGPTQAQDTTKPIRPEVVQTIPDTLLFKIQKAQSVITEVKAANKRGYGVSRIRNGLANVKANVSPIAADIQRNRKKIDAKSLTNYSIILNDGLKKLAEWRTTLSKSTNDIQRNLDNVLALSSDSVLIVAGSDSTEKKLYVDQLSGLKVQLQDAGIRTSGKLDTVSRLLADVSGTYLSISTLQTSINEQLQKSTINAFQKESPYLWEAPDLPNVNTLLTAFQASYEGQNKILSFFFSSNWDNRFLLVLLAGLFFIWVFSNYKKARTATLRKEIGLLRYENLKPVPIVASLLVLLILAPLFEPYSPSLYIEITHLLLFIVLSIHLWPQFSKHDTWMWLSMGGLYVALLLVNTLVADSIVMRLGLIGLDVAFLYIGIVFFSRLQRKYSRNRLSRSVSKLYLIGLGLAIILNVLGRMTLAKAFSITSVIGLIQLMGLGVFIEIMLEALDLQIKISASSAGVFSRVNINHTRRSIKKGLAFVAILLWVLVFFINIGIVDWVFALLAKFLTQSRTFGSISFTLGNVLSFSIIIYLSSLLQKKIGLFFGESQLPVTDGKVGQLSSVLALVRLVIIVVGVLLAVAASGISIDKFTVVLGALSVGIGLGMQNLVNNFVSGIILIFEKPFQIGDYVELGDKKGRIRDIGIRSSKMITAQGSEVIIPNGDLLSNRLVNWTSSETYLKSEFTLKVSADTDLQMMQDIIKTEVSKLDEAINTMPPEILITAIGGDSVELKVLVWIRSIYSEASIKSQLLQRLLTTFKEANIKVI
ncbi:hypothetical protein GCM10028807_34100 [Spirosoma daeguense]